MFHDCMIPQRLSIHIDRQDHILRSQPPQREQHRICIISEFVKLRAECIRHTPSLGVVVRVLGQA